MTGVLREGWGNREKEWGGLEQNQDSGKITEVGVGWLILRTVR